MKIEKTGSVCVCVCCVIIEKIGLKNMKENVDIEKKKGKVADENVCVFKTKRHRTGILLYVYSQNKYSSFKKRKNELHTHELFPPKQTTEELPV